MTTTRLLAVLLALVFAPFLASAAPATWPRFAEGSVCRFNPSPDYWEGSCGVVFDGTPEFTLRRSSVIASGFWRRDRRPTQVWSGDMREADGRVRPFEIEIYDGGAGVIRTEYGWFPVVDFHASGAVLQFRFDADHEVDANGVDTEIIERAASLLAKDAAWNRADDRNCPAGAKTWSIYCAMEQATQDVTGGIHHRRPAMELVRELVDQRTAGRDYSHRLMDYNNDPTTTLVDVKSLFAEALLKIQTPRR